MFNSDTSNLQVWFYTNLVSPIQWELDHPDDIPVNASNKFKDHIDKFLSFNYKVWDIQNQLHATTYLELVSKRTSQKIVVGGRADYLVTHSHTTKANYLSEILCVVEIQSRNDETICELQMLVYLLILMNAKNLKWLVGFLVLTDGRCRAFKATRNELGDCVYEMNSCFHVGYIANIFSCIISELNN